MAERVFIRCDIIPATPGFSIRYLVRDADDQAWELSDPETVIAWRIHVHADPDDDFDTECTTWPVLVDELSPQSFVVIDPSGRVTWQHHATFQSIDEVLPSINRT